MQIVVQVQDFLPLPFHQLGNRDAGPLGDDAGDFLLGDSVMDHGAGPALLRQALRLLQLLLQGGQVGVFQLGRLLILVAQLGVLDLAVQLLDLGLQALDLVHAVLLCLPAGLHGIEAVLHVGQFLPQLGKAVLAQLIVLFLEGHFLDLQLHDPAAHIVQLGRHGVDLGADQGAGLVHQVDGLIRQETVGDIAVGQGGGGHQGVVVDADAMVDLIALLQATKNGDGVLHGGFIHLHRLETPLQGRVLLDILAVLVQGGGADAVQLAPGQHGL